MNELDERLDVRAVVLRGTRGAGMLAFFDPEDAAIVNVHHWYLSQNGYATTSRGITMHRVVMKAKPGQEVDHINGTKLDNRKANLRFVTRAQNNANARQHRHSQQPYKGIRLNPSGHLWQARIRIDGVDTFLGNHKTAEEAARAYDEAARKHFGEFAKVNFAEVTA